MTTFEYASSKLGKIKPETLSIAKEVFNAATLAKVDIWFMWGKGTGPEHSTGCAIDYMVRNHTGGQFVRDYIWRNRARLRLKHVIWEQHITSTVYRPGVVAKMEDRGNSTANHFDHVHALNFPGTYVPIPKPVPPKPVPTKTITQVAQEVIAGKWGNGDARKAALSKAGYNPALVQTEVNRILGITPVVTKRTLYWNKTKMLAGNDVLALQKGLRRVFPLYSSNVGLTGSFGPETDKAVREFQRRALIKVDGQVGATTRNKLASYGVRL